MNNQQVTISREELSQLISEAVKVAINEKEEISRIEHAKEVVKDGFKDNMTDIVYESYKGLFIDKLSTFVQATIAYLGFNCLHVFSYLTIQLLIVSLVVFGCYLVIASMSGRYNDASRFFGRFGYSTRIDAIDPS